MSDYCSTTSESATTTPKRYTCPVNHGEYQQVATKTVIHQVKKPWNHDQLLEDYYYCDDPKCDVVYFTRSNKTLLTHELRSEVGVKQTSADATLCYCFDISYQQASVNPALKKYVMQMTAQQLCECATRNPSGKCCLKYFP